MTDLRNLIAVSLLSLVVTACAQQPSSTPEPSPTPDSLAQDCASPKDGYRIGYPEGWHVNDPEGGQPCSWFHPEEFTVPVATEPTELSVHIEVATSPLGEMADGVTTGPHVKEVLSRRDIELAGQEGLRAEVLNTGAGLYPEDTRQVTYLVSWDGGTLVASTTSAADADYEESVEILDQMMRTLEPYEAEADCSAAVLDPAVPQQEGLPGVVAAMRRDIARAAAACDYEGLEELTERGGDAFTYSFGGGEEPATFWRREEGSERADGSDPMRYLVGVLKRSFSTRQVQGETYYVWPAAFAHDSWAEVPEQEKQELFPLYNELDFKGFEEFGGYIGYRVAIDSEGHWRYFVAGD